MTPEVQHKPTLRERLQGRTGLALALSAMAGGLLLVLLFALLLLRDGGDGQVPTPPVFVQPIPPNDVLVVGLGGTGAISLTVDSPATMMLGSRQYAVQAQSVGFDGGWLPTSREEGAAVWVYGTVVNYVVGIPDTEANRAALDGLTTADEIVLTTRGGNELRFAFRSREVVPQNNPDVFAQNRPGITILLYGTENTTNRLVVRGRYLAGASPAGSPGDTLGSGVAELGETAQLDDLQLTVTGATFQFDRPEAPTGFDFYLIDYQIQNLGGGAIDVGDLRMTLADAFGNQYALNGQASQLGNFPPLFGALNPGQSATATAGYQIPSGLASAQLTWVVERGATGHRLQVNIPFGDGPGAGEVLANLLQADVSPDGGSVLLFGTVTNAGSEQLVVNERDVRLVGEAGTIYLLFSTNPGFPWVVAPGQTLNFAVAFQRPETPSAFFTVLEHRFQLSGLR